MCVCVLYMIVKICKICIYSNVIFLSKILTGFYLLYIVNVHICFCIQFGHINFFLSTAFNALKKKMYPLLKENFLL